MRTPALPGLVALALCAAGSPRAEGLSGTYAGALSCKLRGAAIADQPSLIAISQRGGSSDPVRLAVEIDGVRYGGRAADGSAALTRCGAINPAYGDRAGGFEEVAVGVDPASGATTLHVAQRFEFGTCEATWTRIDASDPRVPACGQ